MLTLLRPYLEVNQREWEALYSERPRWLRNFGSGIPVRVAEADPESKQLYDLVKQLVNAEAAYVLIQGGPGTGKSMGIAAADAALSDAQIEHVVLDPSQSNMLASLFGSLGRVNKGPVVLVDNCDRFEPTLSSLVQRRSSLAGFIVTTAEVGSGITSNSLGLVMPISVCHIFNIVLPPCSSWQV